MQKGPNTPVIPVAEYAEESEILPNNWLKITVSSASVLDNELREQFNLMPLVPLDLSASKASSDMRFQDYLVDKNGEISYPILGKIKVDGLTTFAVQELLTKELSKYISQPIVNVSLYNNKIKVLGEVNSPGIYGIGNESRYSVLDALSYAGDITLAGNKRAVKLLRENREKGEMEYAILDLTSTDIFSSPYFYLKQNDIIVVDPSDTRKKDSKYGLQDNYRLSVISTAMGIFSLIATTIITVISINK
jgi:polysaccharide export outer membrane protein